MVAVVKSSAGCSLSTNSRSAMPACLPACRSFFNKAFVDAELSKRDGLQQPRTRFQKDRGRVLNPLRSQLPTYSATHARLPACLPVLAQAFGFAGAGEEMEGFHPT